ncbi:TnpV protein [Citricoccus sp. NPDC079358]|uniref:TnpV protein n=1 Tax=Citricoccus sp. NPDC079358 TaxID=3154653 RepID=UPI00344D4829
MNRYGKHAQETWKMLAPTQYAQIPDPEAWFTTLGQEAETSVGELSVQLAGPDPEGETYLEKVGRLNAATSQAEEIVRAEMLTPQDQDSMDEDKVDEPSLIGIHLEFMREARALHRESVEELNRVEMERDQPDLHR